MSKKTSKEETHTAQPPLPPRWKGSDSDELIHRLNARAFTLLKQSRGPHSELWAVLDETAIRRAAAFSFLIVDVHFIEEGWWRTVLLNPQGVPGERPGLWPAGVAGKFMSEVLVFAWHTAKWDPRVARLVLGMVPAVADIIRELAPEQLDAVSEFQSGALRLRWQDDVEFWTRLTQAVREGERQALADIHLHAKLRLSGELMARSTGLSKI